MVSTRVNKDGSKVASLQVAHNTCEPKAKTPEAEIPFAFARREEVDREALRQRVRSITRLLAPEDELTVAMPAGEGEPVRFIESWPMGRLAAAGPGGAAQDRL